MNFFFGSNIIRVKSRMGNCCQVQPKEKEVVFGSFKMMPFQTFTHQFEDSEYIQQSSGVTSRKDDNPQIRISLCDQDFVNEDQSSTYTPAFLKTLSDKEK
ncbi:hypothetical protein pb186bvf_001250 [Paramecium bursaria]